MVEASSAELAREDSTGVELNGVGGNGNRGWVQGDGGKESVAIVLRNILPASDDDVGVLGLSGLALLISTLVWVSSLELDTVLLDVVEGVVHQTTVATVVSFSSRAVNELLLGELVKWVTVDLGDTFEGGDGGEGPA